MGLLHIEVYLYANTSQINRLTLSCYYNHKPVNQEQWPIVVIANKVPITNRQ